jgi:hypothetical protein
VSPSYVSFCESTGTNSRRMNKDGSNQQNFFSTTSCFDVGFADGHRIVATATAVFAAKEDDSPSILVAGELRKPASIAVRGGKIYFSESEASPARIVEGTFTTNGAAHFAGAETALLAADDTHVYYADRSGPQIGRVDRSSKEVATAWATIPATVGDGGLAVDKKHVYFAIAAPGGGLYRLPLASPLEVEQLLSVDMPGDIVLDDASVFVAARGSSSILRVPKSP